MVDHAAYDAAQGELDLSDLIDRVASDRDRGAFVQLFDYFAPRIRSFCIRLGVDQGMADELVQDVMLTVWRRAASYDARLASVSTWVYTIARNRRIDVIRRQRRVDWDPTDPALVPEPEPNAAEIRLARENGKQLNVALTALPPEQLDVMRRAFFEDKSHTTIASEMNVPLGTVKSRIRLALTRLRASMEQN